jgi:hypothetical protein
MHAKCRASTSTTIRSTSRRFKMPPTKLTGDSAQPFFSHVLLTLFYHILPHPLNFLAQRSAHKGVPNCSRLVWGPKGCQCFAENRTRSIGEPYFCIAPMVDSSLFSILFLLSNCNCFVSTATKKYTAIVIYKNWLCSFPYYNCCRLRKLIN